MVRRWHLSRILQRVASSLRVRKSDFTPMFNLFVIPIPGLTALAPPSPSAARAGGRAVDLPCAHVSTAGTPKRECSGRAVSTALGAAGTNDDWIN